MKILDFGKFQTGNGELQETIRSLPSLAKSRQSFLVLGEVGTGRKLLAQMIHENSKASGQALQLYRKDKVGAISNGAVLIAELQFLNFREQEVLLEQMLNSTTEVIWIATAQLDFQELVRRGLVRKDLAAQFQQQFRLPNLEERAIDRDFLIDNILMTLSWVMGRVLRLSAHAREILEAHDFRENVKELECILEAAAVSAPASIIGVEHLKLSGTSQKTQKEISTLADMEKKLIMQTLELTQNNKSQAARMLGISIRTLRNKLTLYRDQFEGMQPQEAMYE